APGEKHLVYSGTVEFGIPITRLLELNSEAATSLNVKIEYQACSDRECLRPSAVSKTVAVAFLQPAVSRQVPPRPDEAGLARSGSLLADVFARRGYLAGFVLVFLGGLALNVTPCVYPLIAVTIAYFGYEGGGPRKVVILALLYMLGIALTFSSVGVAAAL